MNMGKGNGNTTTSIFSLNGLKNDGILRKMERKYLDNPFLLSFSLPDVLWDNTDLIWRKGTPFEAMTCRTAPSSDGLLAEVFWGFPQL